MPTVQAILDKTSITDDLKPNILHCVEFHDEYGFTDKGQTVDDIETLILQDADNMDAIGAIGIGRAFAYGGVYGEPMWEPDEPLGRVFYDPAAKDPSVIHHFYSKLFRLKENMSNETAKAMAERRHQVMKQFVEEFIAEWRGER